MQPVSLGNQHRNQLPPTNYHCSENLTFSIRQCSDKAFPLRMPVENLSHLGKHSGINTISFREVSHGAGKVTSLSGVNHGKLKTFCLKRTDYGGFKSSICLHLKPRKGGPSPLSKDGVQNLPLIADRKIFKKPAGGKCPYRFCKLHNHPKQTTGHHYYPPPHKRYGVLTTVRVSDEWLSVCAIR